MSKQLAKILLVEDDLGHAELIKVNLRRSGLPNPIIHFETGQKALDYLSERKICMHDKEIMILDLNLPGMDGHQILRQLKSHPINKKIPVVVLTTASNQDEINQCYEEGCNMYVTKNVDYQEFSLVVKSLGNFLQRSYLPTLGKS